jgi:hypothetical protein
MEQESNTSAGNSSSRPPAAALGGRTALLGAQLLQSGLLQKPPPAVLAAAQDLELAVIVLKETGPTAKGSLLPVDIKQHLVLTAATLQRLAFNILHAADGSPAAKPHAAPLAAAVLRLTACSMRFLSSGTQQCKPRPGRCDAAVCTAAAQLK